jgi:hypothetical protein
MFPILKPLQLGPKKSYRATTGTLDKHGYGVAWALSEEM